MPSDDESQKPPEDPTVLGDGSADNSTELSDVSSAIPSEIVDELESMPAEFRPEIARIFAQMSISSGPLPPPNHYEQYDKILPGSANRILVIAEQNAKHRRDVEMLIVKGQIKDSVAERLERSRGQLCGLTIGVVTVVAGAITAALGQPWAGGFIGTSGVAGLVSVFVLGRKADKKGDEKTERKDGPSSKLAKTAGLK